MSNACPELVTQFETMDYNSRQDALTVAKAWLKGKDGMMCFRDGKLETGGSGAKSEELKDQSTNDVLTTISLPSEGDLKQVFESSLNGQKEWEKVDSHGRGKVLLNVAKKLQEQKALLSEIEALTFGSLPSMRNIESSHAHQFFQYYAGWSHLLSEASQEKKHGVVVACLVKPSPLIALLAMVSPALSVGNAVLIHAATEASIPAFVLAEICAEAGLPNGVVNVIPGPLSEVTDLIKEHALQVSVWGPKTTLKGICCQLTNVGQPVTPFSFGKSCSIIFNVTDISSAINILTRNMNFSNLQHPWSVNTIFVEEAAYQCFAEALKKKLVSSKVGGLYDMGADIQLPGRCDKETSTYLNSALQDISLRGVEIYKIAIEDDLFYSPTVVVGCEAEVNVISKDFEILPFVSVVPFRTPKEVVEMVNKKQYGVAASIWTDSMPEAISVANSLEVGTVWINDHGLIDPSVPFTNWKDGGVGCFGGQEGIYQYTACHLKNGAEPRAAAKDCGQRTERESSAQIDAVVSAAKKAQLQWAKLKSAEKSALLLNAAYLFHEKCEDFESGLKTPGPEGKKEIESCVNHFYYWATQCDKLSSARCSNTPSGIVNILRYPRGVIGIVLEDKSEIESLVLSTVQAISFGNCVLVVPNQINPELVSKFCGLLNEAKIPSGLVNVLSVGSYNELILSRNVNSVWYSGNQPEPLYSMATKAMKSVWCSPLDAQTVEFAASLVKSVWLPWEK